MTGVEEYSKEIGKLRGGYDDGRFSEYESSWRLDKHRIFDEAYRPKDTRTYNKTIKDSEGGKKSVKVTESVEVNRIGLPVEQDIVNIHTSFCVGIDPDLGANPEGPLEQSMLELILTNDRANKISNRNREVVRSLFAESMVAEYWYTDEDERFYRKHKHKAKRRPKMVVWSPFRGDKLVPVKDSTGRLVRFLRFYEVKRGDKMVQKAMDIDHNREKVLEHINGTWTIIEDREHGFDKIPVIYMQREEPLCWPIKHLRERLELLMSNFADTIDYNAAPKMVGRGNITGIQKRGRNQLVLLNGEGASLDYLSWNQSSDAVHLEMETVIDYAYQMTNTPRISLKDMQGAGNGFSGESFRYVFMGTHMAVRNHEEIIGEYLQRRYNFLLSAFGALIPELEDAQYMEIEPKLVPYIIERDEPEEKKE